VETIKFELVNPEYQTRFQVKLIQLFFDTKQQQQTQSPYYQVEDITANVCV
jgi:hypothetical protein